MALILTSEHEDLIRRHSTFSYPGECCGAFIGQIVNGSKYVAQAIPLNNSHEDGPDRRFRLDPYDLLQVERLARKVNASVIGFFHSHPDVPPVPSAYDFSHAWESYSYLIVQVNGGQAKVMRSWVLNAAADDFLEEKIVINDCVLELSAIRAHNGWEVSDGTTQF